jgi:hypothetical protein
MNRFTNLDNRYLNPNTSQCRLRLMFSNLTLGKKDRNVILATIFVLGLFTLSGVALTSFAATGSSASNTLKASINISPDRAQDNGFVAITGVGFLPNHSISFSFGGKHWDGTATNSTGGFYVLLEVPTSPAGSYKVTATDGTHSASKSLSVFPFLETTHHYYNPGASMTVMGSGFAANSLVEFTLSDGAKVGSVTSSNVGGFGTSVTVPANTPAGVYKLTATDASGNSKSTTFHVN